MSETQCGNSRHPDGAWHPATPLPPSFHYRERFVCFLRRKRYGCGCAAANAGGGRLLRRLLAAAALVAILAYLAAPVAPLEVWEDGSGTYHARAGDVAFCIPGDACAEGQP